MATYQTGVVLSGGGLRGIAHAGVLKYLNENGIEPEIFSCCSAGSIVGAMYAFGKTPEEILQLFKSVYFFHWRHFSPMKGGIVSSVVFSKYLLPVFNDATIGDLRIPIRIVATEMVSGQQKIFEPETRVIDAIIASSSIPGVATPLVMNDEVYCDGGVLNNFPADVLEGSCEKMIGVYVGTKQEVSIQDLKSIKAVTARAYELLAYRIESPKFSLCDVLITDERLSKFGTLSAKKIHMDEIFQIGYEAAQKAFS